MPKVPDLFPSFTSQRVEVPGLDLYVRTGGNGPALLLLHGYPQTHVCWHRIARPLAEHFSLVIPDLRGYGQSGVPEPVVGHASYSKRAMANDVLALMAALGHTRFAVVGHDRGARVGYRLALDHADAVSRLVVLDILPTFEVWERMGWETALAAYHWAFLAQPAPLPETLISADPGFYVEQTLLSWTRDKCTACFDPSALALYRAALNEPRRVRAVCEDYRAGATFDRLLDAADRAAGRRIDCPVLALWGRHYVGKAGADVLAIWRAWAHDVTGAEIDAGHFLAEENPAATLAALMPFLTAA